MRGLGWVIVWTGLGGQHHRSTQGIVVAARIFDKFLGEGLNHFLTLLGRELKICREANAAQSRRQGHLGVTEAR
jgi:hypothetical protein